VTIGLEMGGAPDLERLTDKMEETCVEKAHDLVVLALGEGDRRQA